MPRCAECGEAFPTSELMAFSEFHVCPECKPVAVAKLARGEPVGNIWRDGRKLVIPRNGLLPDRCVRCNQPAEGYRVNTTYTWRHPALSFLLPVLGLLIVPFVAKTGPFFSAVKAEIVVAVVLVICLLISFVFSRSSKMGIPLCARHRKRRILGSAAAMAGVIVVVAISAGAVPRLRPIFAFTLFLGAASAIALILAIRLLVPTRITRSHVFLTGACEEFLAELPRWPRS